MTSETRTFVDFSDILSIEMECQKCHTKQTRPIGNTTRFPTHCASCGPGAGGSEWFFSDSERDYVELREFSNRLQRIAELSESLQSKKLKIRLEIKPSISQTSE